MTTSPGTALFSADFLAVYTAFIGDLTQGDVSLGAQWHRVWVDAQASMRAGILARAASERSGGRSEVADALEAAVVPRVDPPSTATPSAADH